jgi:hypothetical protein
MPADMTEIAIDRLWDPRARELTNQGYAIQAFTSPDATISVGNEPIKTPRGMVPVLLVATHTSLPSERWAAILRSEG